MNTAVSELVPTLWVEFRKVWRSRMLWISALAFTLITLIGGLFMYILEDPERARSLGLLGAKAQIFGGSADWLSFLSLMLVMVSVGGLVVFGLIFVWVFGREFSDKTVYDMLSLPTSRVTIVSAKVITAVYWSVALIILSFVLMLGVGEALGLPGWSAEMVLNGLKLLLVTGLLTVLLCIPFGLAASIARGYLPAVGCIFLVLVLAQVVDRLGYGPYFPWDVPLLYSGAAEMLTGGAPTPLGFISFMLVGLVGLLGWAVTAAWWRYADQT
jgi:ABC-2 type transport system permease protein